MISEIAMLAGEIMIFSMIIIWCSVRCMLKKKSILDFIPFFFFGVTLSLYSAFIFFSYFFDLAWVFLELLILINIIWVFLSVRVFVKGFKNTSSLTKTSKRRAKKVKNNWKVSFWIVGIVVFVGGVYLEVFRWFY